MSDDGSKVIQNKVVAREPPEEMQLPATEQSSKAESQTKNESTQKSPISSSLTAKIAILFCGVTSILPFNIFVVAAGFFNVRLHDTKYDTSFPIYIQFVAIMSNLVGSAANIYLSKTQYLQRLTVASNLIHGGPMAIMSFFAFSDTSTWSLVFFEISLLMLALSGLGHAVQTSCLTAVINITSPSLNVWFFTGKGIAGFVAVCLNLITVSFPGMNLESAACWYFLVTFILCFPVVSIIEYKLVYYPEVNRAIKSKALGIEESKEPETDVKSISSLLRSNWDQCLVAFLAAFVSLVIYPALSTKILQMNPTDGQWSKIYFQPVTIFLVWAVGDIVGKIPSAYVHWPGRRLLVTLSIVRLILIPLILMCNVQPRTWTVWFKSDVLAPIFIFTTAFTGGHFINLNFMYAPTYFEGSQNKGRITTVMFFFLSIGMAIASCIIFGISELINL